MPGTAPAAGDAAYPGSDGDRALEDHGSIAKAYEAGATDFISKPLNWSILKHRVRYMLRGAYTLEDLRRHQQRLRAAQEQEREQSETGSEAALGNMSQGLCMFSADGKLIVTNRRFCDMLQVETVVPGQSMTELLRGSPLFAGPSGRAADAALAEHLALTSLARQRGADAGTRGWAGRHDHA